MYIKEDYIKNIDDFDEKIDNSYNGTCFAYSWFLKLKDTDKVLKIIEGDKLIGVMPLFKNENERIIAQSTMYIPYGGPVLFEIPKENRNKIRFIRRVEKVLIDYLKNNYDKVTFSLDDKIIDIMPFIRSNFIPENRYTYKLDITKSVGDIYHEFGHDRKKDLRKANKRNFKLVIDKEVKYFNSKKAMKWETNYGNSSSHNWVEKYIKQSIFNKRGMSFVAFDNDKSVGGVHIVWDKQVAYILYSYYEKEKDDVAIAYLYYEIIKYLKENKLVKYLDFEGSVFESIEDWNISFGAFQSRFYNLHWDKTEDKCLTIYDYGEK